MHARHTPRVLRPRCPRSHSRASARSGAHALVCRSGGGRGVMILFWLVRSLVVRIFGLCCLGVRNFGFTVFWLAGCLGVRIPGFTVTLDLRILQHTWISGSLCGCLLRVVWFFGFFLGSHGTLVAVSAPFMMPLRDSDIPMNVPFTFSNKQPLHLYSLMGPQLP